MIKKHTLRRQRKLRREAQIREGYANGLSPRQIAESIGSTTASVKVTAHRIGCNHDPKTAAALRSLRKQGFEHPSVIAVIEAREIIDA